MNIKRIAIAAFLLCVLAACGNKGPLLMPTPADAPVVVPPADQPTPAEADEPAKTESGTPAR